MEDIGKSEDVKTTKEELARRESEELFSDVSSMEIVETDGFNSTLIEEDGESGYIVEDSLSDVSISEILESNVVLDEAYSDDEVCNDSARDSHSKVPDDILSDISSVCSVPATKGRQSLSKSKHSSKSHSSTNTSAKNKADGSSDKSCKVDSSRRRHESTNTSVSKASSEKSESRQPSSHRKLPEGIIPLKDRKDEYRCTVCYCYLASKRIMEHHVDDHQHRRRTQHIATIGHHHSSSHSSRQKRKCEDYKESHKSTTKVKESSDSKKSKLGTMQENKETQKIAAVTSSKQNTEETKRVTEKSKENRGEEKTASNKNNQKEALADIKKTAPDNAKEDKKRTKSTVVEDKEQRQAIVDKKDLAPDNAKEDKKRTKSTVVEDKEQRQALVDKKDLAPEKLQEKKDSEEKLIIDDKKEELSTDSKKTITGTIRVEKEAVKPSSTSDKNQEKISANTDKVIPGKIEEGKEAVKVTTEKKKDTSSEVSGQEEGLKEMQAAIKEKTQRISSSDTKQPVKGKTEEIKKEAVKMTIEKKQETSAEASGQEQGSKEIQVAIKEKMQRNSSSDTKQPVKGKTEEGIKEAIKVTTEKKQETSAEASGKTEEGKKEGVKVTTEKKQDTSAEASEKNKEHKQPRKGKDHKESHRDGDHKEFLKDRDHNESQRDRSNKELQRDKDCKEYQKVRDHKESQKDKSCKETQRERDNKGSEKEATKGKENSSSTRKSGKKREKEVEKVAVSSEISSESKKPRLESETDNKDQKNSELKGDPRVLRNLSDMKQPILGIEEISLSGNDGNWIYHCELCSVACGSIDIRHHLLGRRHRTSYALRHQQETSANSISQANKNESFYKPIPTVKSNREKPYMHRGHKFRDDAWHINQPELREERNFRENEPPFPNERSDDWKQAHWNDCCNSFLKITMDRKDSPSRHGFEHPKDRPQQKPFQGHFSEELVSNIHKSHPPHEPQFDIQGPPQQPEYVSRPHFLPSQHPTNPSHFQEHPPHFQGPEGPPSFQQPRQPFHFQDLRGPPNFQELQPPPHFPVSPHLHQSKFPMPRQFPHPEFQVEPQFQQPVFGHQHPDLAVLEDNKKLKEQKNQARQLIVIPTSDKPASSKPAKDIATIPKPVEEDNILSTKSSEAALDIINLMIQDYLKNELQKLPSQLQKILCESTRTDGGKRSMQAVSGIETIKDKNSSSSNLPVESKMNLSENEVRNSASTMSQDNKKENPTKALKRVNPEDVASSFDQHSYKNVENMQTIPFLDKSADSPNEENKIKKFSNDNQSSNELSNNQRNMPDDTSITKDEALNSQNDNTASASAMNATNNCFEQFIKSWIEQTGAVPVRSTTVESLDKSSDLKENTMENKNTGETPNQVSPDFGNIDHAELGRQVAAFLSKHSANWSENIGNILLGRNPQSSVTPLNSEKEMTSNPTEITQYSRGHGIDDTNRHVGPFIDQNNRDHSIQGMNRCVNPIDVRQFSNEYRNIRDENYYKRVPDNWDGNPRNRGNNPSNQSASYWVASGRDGLPTRIYFDDTADSYERMRSEMARGNINSMSNSYQERRMNTDDIRERQQKDYNRRGRGTLPFRSAHSLSFLDLLNQHRNDPVFSSGLSRSVSRRNYY